MPTCPTPFKLRFVNRSNARQAALQMAERLADKRRTGRGKGKTVSRRVPGIYECACGGYHLVTRRGELTQK